jgi:hypothetical protein
MLHDPFPSSPIKFSKEVQHYQRQSQRYQMLSNLTSSLVAEIPSVLVSTKKILIPLFLLNLFWQQQYNNQHKHR